MFENEEDRLSEQNGDIDDLDLVLENESLELDVRIKGGELYKGEEVDDEPELYNQFLKSILEFETFIESGDDRPLGCLFPDVVFPPADEIDDQQIKEKLELIEEVFDANNIALPLLDKLPARVVYKYLTEEALLEPAGYPFGPDDPGTLVIDGCGGYCPGCFQKDYCETAAEWDLEDNQKL